MDKADKVLTKQHIDTLASLIDNEDDDLAGLLRPIRQFLERISKPTDRGLGTYTIAVYWCDNGNIPHHAGTWKGTAENEGEARSSALNHQTTHQIEHWSTEVLDFSPIDD